MIRTKKAAKFGLGKAILKDKSKSKRASGKDSSWLHTSELEDGYDWGRLNLRSVTEESKLDEFLNTAKLAGTEFTAEKLNIKVVDPGIHTGLPSMAQYAEIEKAQKDNWHFLGIPRRPKWDSSTTAEQLDLYEREAFLEWRRNLAKLEENEKLVLTPFEKNLEFWRQLWRVIEKSDVIVQIVDARNPLLFRCEDLEKYVKEISSQKVNFLLISKADLLTPTQRKTWLEYFQRTNDSITVAFWSANQESERLQRITESSVLRSNSPSSIPDPESDQDTPVQSNSHRQVYNLSNGSSSASSEETEESNEIDFDKETAESMELADGATVSSDGGESSSEEEVETKTGRDEQMDYTLEVGFDNSQCRDSTEAAEIVFVDDDTRLLNGEELIDLLLAISPVNNGELTTVGMVGYPNVGKSSTINALIQTKKVPVSATPGRTKHFQTLYLSDSLLLCDCPGLVFPTFVTTKAEMVCSGILPIDQMRDHMSPISLVCSRVPRPVFERLYGIRLPAPREGEDPNRPPYAEELCEAYGYVRGYMTSHGRPDGSRSARYILKNYVNGRLLYCHPPPRVDPVIFNQFPLPPGHQCVADSDDSSAERLLSEMDSKVKVTCQRSEFDEDYFQQQANVRSIQKVGPGAHGYGTRQSGAEQEGKPWKKHNNRHKKEKTRRIQPAVF